ncbi:MAG: hypothetical protein K8R23_08420 [Chthoniobacter sp.]|nr:hypothetical protein [Chthoniobacter sp.]
MKLHSLLVLLSVAAAPPVHSAPPGLSTGALGSSLRGSGPITSASGTMTSLPGAATTGGLSFDVRSTTGGGVGSNAGTTTQTGNNGKGNAVGDFSTTRTHKSKMSIEIQIRNVSAQPATGRFDWFFFAQNSDGGVPFVCNNGEREMTVAALGQAREAAASAEITSSVTRTIHRTQTGTGPTAQVHSTSSETKTGSRPYGWVVRMFVGGQLARVQASTSALDQLARSPQLDQMAKQKPK